MTGRDIWRMRTERSAMKAGYRSNVVCLLSAFVIPPRSGTHDRQSDPQSNIHTASQDAITLNRMLNPQCVAQQCPSASCRWQ